MRKIGKILAIVLIFACLLLCFIGCKAKEPNLSGYTKEAQIAIKDFVKLYGHSKNAYVVSDFDNTTSIYDITYQCSVYQILTMSFKMTPTELRDSLSKYVSEDETAQKYINDTVYAYEQLLAVYGEFTPAGVSQNQLEELHNNVYWKEFSTKLKSMYLYIETILDDPTACAWILFWYTNMTENEVYELYKRSCLEYKDADTESVTWTSPDSITSEMGVVSCSFILGCSVTDSVKNMLAYYHDNGIDTWICSASHVDGVRAAVDAYGLSSYITGVIGMTQKVVDGKLVAEYDYETGYPYENKNGVWTKLDTPIKALPSREGKVTAINNVLVKKYNAGPLAGFMDASGDFNFCTEFESMKMVICYNRADRKITDGAGLVAIAAMSQKNQKLTLAKANEKGDTYYLLQGRDENNKRSLREDEGTIKYGKSEAQVFANESNAVLLKYLEDNNLSLKTFFDTFAIATSKEESPIGLAYGYLDEYRGYHSVK